ncbi:MAG: exodeoxyribonuclease V alpha subunit [Hyphomicrobiaceae bacterium]|jgi:exodeoxyribonuclease V alpha subunit
MNDTQLETTALATLHGDLLCRLATGGNLELLRCLVTALGTARDEGHVCIDLALWRDEQLEVDEAPRPDLLTIREQLLATGVVGNGTSNGGEQKTQRSSLPLVLDAQNRLYTLRHYRAEQRIAQFVQDRLQREPTTTPEKLRETLTAVGLLPKQPLTEPDWQLAAVVAGATRSLTVLCGGPGTGKTTTVAKLLSALLHDDPAMRIAIAAPTGKAAARLGEALQERAAAHRELSEPLANLDPRTLHRLLGYLPLDDAFRFGRDKKLPYDLVVIDEVSMVDPAIFAVLCDALPEEARLVLVGDKDQLAAVAAGQVLGDLCYAARPELGLGEQLATFVTKATGMPITAQQNATPIANATVALWQNHRFGQQPGIGAFAQSLMQRRPQDAIAAFSAGHEDLSWTESMDDALAIIEPQLLHLLEAASDNDADRALAAISHARVLTAQRLGPSGAIAWNARVEARLLELGHRTDEPYYPGRPILITSNDQNNRIWNGDLGVCGRNKQGAPVVWVRDQLGKARELNPRRLPAHETAWAMTVHKAQGSEFDHVLLVLPDRSGPLNHAALIYTGVTRARRRATVCANRDLLAAGLAKWPQRRSGLAEALGSK